MAKKCFVVCPIGKEGSDTRNRSNTVMKRLLEPICAEFGYEIIRCDSINNNDKIDETILDHLKNDDLVIADLSEHNPNAFYELGYRTALGMPCIHIAEQNTVLPFDVYTKRTLFYSVNDLEKAEVFKEILKETLTSIGETTRISAGEESKQIQSTDHDEIAEINTTLKLLIAHIGSNFETLDKNIRKYIDEAQQMQKKNDDANAAMDFFGKIMYKGMEDPNKFQSFLNVLSSMQTDNDQNNSDGSIARS